ncbi:hypothetical protein ZOSMA_126G00160 [Zostera marina]|uniref:Uncharacterized protein n=1 Tax=Zostera marina TaxID=29655 RepID=A0A0K9Q250_ZOSMR|nr:hypothetical protein ZOSMA_126G00160 [Zostera marina]
MALTIFEIISFFQNSRFIFGTVIQSGIFFKIISDKSIEGDHGLIWISFALHQFHSFSITRK